LDTDINPRYSGTPVSRNITVVVLPSVDFYCDIPRDSGAGGAGGGSRGGILSPFHHRVPISSEIIIANIENQLNP
jgi:hypothetical protein